MSEGTRRVFFALWPTDELRRDIEHETGGATRRCGGRIIPASNFHITLAFLGSLRESQLIDAVACGATTVVEPFELALGHLNWWERQQLVCLEPSAGVEGLTELVERLRNALRAKGFGIDHRPFRPHLTLARDVRCEHAVNSIRELHWQVHRMELVESKITPTGSVYTLLPT